MDKEKAIEYALGVWENEAVGYSATGHYKIMFDPETGRLSHYWKHNSDNSVSEREYRGEIKCVAKIKDEDITDWLIEGGELLTGEEPPEDRKASWITTYVTDYRDEAYEQIARQINEDY